MCGIAGVMTRNGSAPDSAMLNRMQSAIAHRGPDGFGRLVRDDVALIQVRLAIVDLTTGDQPLFGISDDRQTGTALVGNGEIYNNPELRAAMPQAAFRTRSDCEPPVFLYDTLGAGFADRLRGMFALAVHDPIARRLVLVRDPFGIKPLYYAENAAAFAFASEPQSLLAAGFGSRNPSHARVAELLQLKFTTGAETIFPGIYRALPGETLVVEQGRIVARHRNHALPEGAPRPIRHGDAVRQLDAVLSDSVSAHLQSDVPFGLFLSGGVDSAALLALMTRLTGNRIQALTVGWAGAEGVDETAEARRLARAMGAECERLEMGEADFWNLAPQIAACIDDPTSDAAVLPSWMLGRAARAGGLKVTLCGEGGDELFGGYARYRKQRAPLSWFARKPRSSGVFGHAIPGLTGWRDGLAAAEASAGDVRSAVQAAQFVDCQEWLPNDLLIKLDRTLMVHGVEGRTPFLDPLVAEFAFTLPDSEKVGLRRGKVLLREWLEGAFPQAGAWARKKGFKPPVGGWIARRGKALADQIAHQPGVAQVVPSEVVQAVIANAAEASQPAWSLLHYALWHSVHVLGISAEGPIGEVLEAAVRV
ncbi:MAG: asparagine synthase (glutamine-hydrolyzing) [Acetobacteraceae bacterium]|nr:asparagine synthase (glutamine-hydrolyzing) [Acetobacteraceae bacterium]